MGSTFVVAEQPLAAVTKAEYEPSDSGFKNMELVETAETGVLPLNHSMRVDESAPAIVRTTEPIQFELSCFPKTTAGGLKILIVMALLFVPVEPALASELGVMTQEIESPFTHTESANMVELAPTGCPFFSHW